MLMPVISIRQPWAALIVAGIKDVENRTWRFPVHLTGKVVLVHTGIKPDPSFSVVHQYYDARPGHPEAYRAGGIVGSVVLDGHTRNSGSRWAIPGPEIVTPDTLKS
jgi:hypothetical protein